MYTATRNFVLDLYTGIINKQLKLHLSYLRYVSFSIKIDERLNDRWELIQSNLHLRQPLYNGNFFGGQSMINNRLNLSTKATSLQGSLSRSP